MFAVVRTGGKQYRVAAGDKIVVDRIDGEAGARVSLGDVLFGSDGSAPAVAAEIIAQAKADKVIVFKKKRRHNYRRKAGHRQQHTILKILSVGDSRAEETSATTTPVEAAPAPKAKKVTKPAPIETEVTEADAGLTAADLNATSPEADAIVQASDEAVAEAPVKKAATRKAPAKKPAATQE